MKRIFLSLLALLCCMTAWAAAIDRSALLQRNAPVVTGFDPLQSLSVGNGSFAFTVDATGLQTFPEVYAPGVPLGTMSDWGWHAFRDTVGYTFDQTLVTNDFGRGHDEVYSSQTSLNKPAADWFRMNPHRLHLGTVGLALRPGITMASFTDVRQQLDLEAGLITSTFCLDREPVTIRTCVHPDADMIAVRVEAHQPKPIVLRMPYPTGQHTDDACRWTSDTTLHHTECRRLEPASLDDAMRSLQVTHVFAEAEYSYRLLLTWDHRALGDVSVEQRGADSVIITPRSADFAFTCRWEPVADNSYNRMFQAPAQPMAEAGSFEATAAAARRYWHDYWHHGGIVDFSHCTAPEARELERRVVLSQYLLAVNCAGRIPPQETGLTYNSWFGKFHLEMIWWHQAQFALFGHPELLERSLRWYAESRPMAQQIARRQGFRGVRWMKMTDPTGAEAPSNVGSYLLWQQPHFIYLAELVRRAREARGERLDPAQERYYYELIRQSADFMCDVVSYDSVRQQYGLQGLIPAQETLKAATTVNPPFELAQWHFALGIASQWAQRMGDDSHPGWNEVRRHLSPLHAVSDAEYSPAYGPLYPASADAVHTFHDERLTSDHMAVLGALGIFPASPLVDAATMRNTLRWVLDHWHWQKTWGWDHPMTAMCAARLGEPQLAVDALLAQHRTNTYLVSGHNYQDDRLRIYLPGNGGLLTAIALMCAGGEDRGRRSNPGFPADGRWDVRWEGLLGLPGSAPAGEEPFRLGQDDSRQALQALIDRCHASGGGVVVVPPGVHQMDGPLELKSHVRLHLCDGATLRFTSDPDAYLPVVLTRWEGTELYGRSSMIHAMGQTDVAITGDGTATIDANGYVMARWGMPVGTTDFEENVHGTHGLTPETPDVERLRQMGDDLTPVDQRIFGQGTHLRPCAIELNDCQQVRIEGITLTNSPFWCIHPLYCRDVVIRGVTIDSNFPNNDGCDPESCTNVLIEDCTFRTGDDAVAIKSGRDADGRRVGRPSEHITIRHCRFYSKCNGLCIGSEMSGGVRHVRMSDIEIGDVKNALLFKSNLDRGGYIEHVTVDSIRIGHVAGAVLRFETNYFGYRGGHYPARYQHFNIRDVHALSADAYAIYYDGNPDQPISDIHVERLVVDQARRPHYLYHTEDCSFVDCLVNGQTLPRVLPHDAERQQCDVW